MKSKPNLGQRPIPLNPITPSNFPGQAWSLDHKVLTRKTNIGNTAILVCVDNFSGWPFLIPVRDMSAETTAYAFVQHIIATFGTPIRIFSDKSTSYLNIFFCKICSLLGIKHRTSASLMAKSNGLAESMVKRLSTLLKIYANDDVTLEQQLPIIELSIRSMPISRLQLSPYQILFGREMPINTPGPTNLAVPFTGYKEFAGWLEKLSVYMQRFKERKVQIKQDDKEAYDKVHKVKEATWKVGDRLLLQDVRVKPHSNRIVTTRPFRGPVIIKEIVQGTSDIGQAYKLEREDGGRPLKFLITADRLKIFDTDRTDLLKRLPQMKSDEVES